MIPDRKALEAAAPELYALLSRILDHDQLSPVGDAAYAIDAVLAKARGEVDSLWVVEAVGHVWLVYAESLDKAWWWSRLMWGQSNVASVRQAEASDMARPCAHFLGDEGEQA